MRLNSTDFTRISNTAAAFNDLGDATGVYPPRAGAQIHFEEQNDILVLLEYDAEQESYVIVEITEVPDAQPEEDTDTNGELPANLEDFAKFLEGLGENIQVLNLGAVLDQGIPEGDTLEQQETGDDAVAPETTTSEEN